MNYYELLEVSPNASPEVLKAAYKSLIQRYHPDRNPGDRLAAERSQAIVQAYQVLSDAGKRAAYDLNLKLQAENDHTARIRARDALTPAKTRDVRTSSRGLSWLVIAVGALGLWLAWPAAEINPPDTPPPPSIGSAWLGNAPDPLQDEAGGGEVRRAPRTIPNYLEEMRVTLQSPDKPADTAPAASTHVLSIETIGVVVGPFDPDAFIAFLEANKDYIGQRLAERLATADHAKLIDGRERYLKGLILDSLGKITNTNRPEQYAFPGTASDARYGAVDILLPGSFSVESREPGKTTVKIWTPK